MSATHMHPAIQSMTAPWPVPRLDSIRVSGFSHNFGSILDLCALGMNPNVITILFIVSLIFLTLTIYKFYC